MSAAADSRLTRRFADLRAQGRGGLVTYLTAGDPDYETSLAIFRGLPKAGVDVIEIGMPFSDPMADGPAIQAAGLRALKAGASLKRTLALVAAFRRDDSDTPIVLMGYYNPIYRFGVERFQTPSVSERAIEHVRLGAGITIELGRAITNMHRKIIASEKRQGALRHELQCCGRLVVQLQPQH